MVYKRQVIAVKLCRKETFRPVSYTHLEGSYYSGLNTSLTGDDFRTELAKLLKDTHKHITSYRELLNVY